MMKKLQIISSAILIVSIAGFMIWRFTAPCPDWFVRVTGALMLVSIFFTVFSTVKLSKGRK